MTVLAGVYVRCHGAPDCPPGCDCAEWERFCESDEYPAWRLAELEQADELHPPQPDETAVTAWKCNGLRSCHALVTAPRDLCDWCRAAADDAARDAAMEAGEDRW